LPDSEATAQYHIHNSTGDPISTIETLHASGSDYSAHRLQNREEFIAHLHLLIQSDDKNDAALRHRFIHRRRESIWFQLEQVQERSYREEFTAHLRLLIQSNGK